MRIRVFIMAIMLMQTLSMVAYDYDCKISGICYKLALRERTASVAAGNHDIAENGHIEIPDTICFRGYTFKVTSIGISAFNANVLFSKVESIKSIDLGDNIKKIEPYAFGGCINLKSINLKNVYEIGGCAFSGCSSLENIDIKKLSTIDEYTFNGCSKLISVVFDTVSLLSWDAFDGCFSLTSLKIDSVEKIESYAFNYCTKLTNIEIGNINMIDDDAFAETKGLKILILHNAIPPKVSGNPFPKLAFFATLLVPSGSAEKYRNHPFFGKFLNIEEFENSSYF